MEKYESCICVEKVGVTAVYVTPECKMASMIKEKLVSSKRRCEQCSHWKPKGAI